MKVTLIFTGLLIGLIVTCTLINRTPVKLVTGRVSGIYLAGTKDLIVKVSGIKEGFCLNPEFLKKLDLKELKKRLVGHQVTIHYKAAWTPLDPSSNKQIASIEISEEPLPAENE